MNYQAMVGVLREAGVEVRDQPLLPSALGLPDGARVRLLVDHDGLFRVYYAEHLPSTLPMSRIKGALKAAGDEALLLMDRGGERFVALHTTAEGEGTQAELDEAEVVRLLPNVRAVGGEDPYAVSERVRELILRPEEEREAYQNKGSSPMITWSTASRTPASILSGEKMYRRLARNCGGSLSRRRNTWMG